MKLITPEISWHQKEPILSVHFCAKTWKLATAGADSTAKIWQVRTYCIKVIIVLLLDQLCHFGTQGTSLTSRLTNIEHSVLYKGLHRQATIFLWLNNCSYAVLWLYPTFENFPSTNKSLYHTFIPGLYYMSNPSQILFHTLVNIPARGMQKFWLKLGENDHNCHIPSLFFYFLPHLRHFTII